MARAHLFRPVTDEKGNLLYGAQVTVRKADFAEPIVQTLYAGPLDSAAVMDNPYVADAGYVDIWLDTPERVNLLIESAGRDPITLYLDVNPPASEVVRSLYPLRITNAPASGKVLTGIDETTAEWDDAPSIAPGAVPLHDHDGTGSLSTALGTNASAPAAQATAVGDSSAATGPNSVAFGVRAEASDDSAIAVGVDSVASGVGAVAVGTGARATDGAAAFGVDANGAGVNAVAIGKNAQAMGAGSVALGTGTVALGTEAVAVGDGASANGEDSVAVGHGASAANARAAAFGHGATTTADDQIVLGAAGSTTVVVGDLIAQANARLAGATGTVGFFGQVGTARPEITGVVSDPILFSLLTYLDSIGLITNSATSA